MDLSLTESQKMLRASAREFLKAECPWTAIKEIDESESGFSAKLWQKVAGMGWLGMNLPEEYGGMGCSLTDLAMIYEEMGQGLLPTVFLSSSVLGASIIEEAGSAVQKQELLPAIASGKTILALALTEMDYAWGPQGVSLTATPEGGDFILNGSKHFVFDASVADQLVVVTRTSNNADPVNGITLFLVDTGSSEVGVGQIPAFSGERLDVLTFDGVRVPARNILGEIGAGWAVLERPLNRAAAILCAYMTGACQRLLDMTVEYARTRVQFGQPIGAFQWVQGYIVEQANQLERSRWFTYEALAKLDADKPAAEQNEAVALAKAVASEAFLESSHLGHEVHAGLGVDKKYPLYLYSKKAKTLYSYLGDPYYHRKRVAAILGL